MEETIERFRIRMSSANNAFLHDRIAEQRARKDVGEASKVAMMARFWFPNSKYELEGRTEWQPHKPSQYEMERASPAQEEQWFRETEVKTLDDVASLPHHHMDGTASPPTEAIRKAFLSALDNVVNDLVDDDKFDSRIQLPDDLDEFLKLTSGAYDPDFRQDGICNFSPLPSLPPHACSEQAMYMDLKCCANPEAWESEGFQLWQVEEEFEVAVGLLLDRAGQWPPNHRWPEGYRCFSLLAYCKSVPDMYDLVEYPEEVDDWKWRILFYCRTGDIEYDLHSFDTIADFLDWYASWDERLDDSAMREAVRTPSPGNTQALF